MNTKELSIITGQNKQTLKRAAIRLELLHDEFSIEDLKALGSAFVSSHQTGKTTKEIWQRFLDTGSFSEPEPIPEPVVEEEPEPPIDHPIEEEKPRFNRWQLAVAIVSITLQALHFMEFKCNLQPNPNFIDYIQALAEGMVFEFVALFLVFKKGVETYLYIFAGLALLLNLTFFDFFEHWANGSLTVDDIGIFIVSLALPVSILTYSKL